MPRLPGHYAMITLEIHAMVVFLTREDLLAFVLKNALCHWL